VNFDSNMSEYDPIFGGKISGFLANYQTTQQICHNYSKSLCKPSASTTGAGLG
jgi:hypothetical protein